MAFQGVSEGVKDKDAAGGDSSDDEFKVKDDQDFMTGTKWDAKQRMTVRNLRIREDTAKVSWLTVNLVIQTARVRF